MFSSEYIPKFDISVCQSDKGYKYNEDSFYLIDFVKKIHKSAKVAELGAGCGIISLCLSKMFKTAKFYPVEIQNESYHLLAQNININKLSGNIFPIHSDYRNLPKNMFSTFDIVITNPPYRNPNTGRIATLTEKKIARHEIFGSIEDIVITSKNLLKDKGVFYAVFLAERAVDLVTLLRNNNIEPKEILPIYPKKDKDSGIILIKAIKKSGVALKIKFPIIKEN